MTPGKASRAAAGLPHAASFSAGERWFAELRCG